MKNSTDDQTLILELSALRKRVVELEKIVAEQQQTATGQVESQERFRKVFDYAAIGMALLGLDGYFIEVNPYLCEMLGYTKAELENKTFLEITHPIDRQFSQDCLEQLIEKKLPFVWVEKRYLHKDGHLVWVMISSSLFCDAVGKPLYVISHLQDISERKLAEQALQEKENRYQQLVENAPAAIFEIDLINDQFVSTNNSFCQLTGYSKEEIAGMKASALLSGESVAIFQEHQRLDRDGQSSPKTTEYQLKTKDNGTIWMNLTRNIIYKGLKPIRVQIVAQDITQHKIAEEEIRYHLRIENAIDNISKLFLTSTHADLNIVLKILGEAVDVNRAYIFQINNDLTKISNTHEWCSPETSPKNNKLQDVNIKLFPWYMEKINRHENIVISDTNDLPPEAASEKKLLLVQQTKSLIAVPIYLHERLLGMMGFENIKKPRNWSAHDAQLLSVVSEMIANEFERYQAEEALRESKERYKGLVENSPTGIISIDIDGKIIDANHRLLEILGSPSLEATKSINIFKFKPLIENGATEDFRKCIQSGKTVINEKKYISKWGKNAFLLYHLNPIRSNKGVIVGVLANVVDITQSRQLEEQVHQMQKMEAIGRLAGGVAHDFNNLLTAIKGYARLIMNDLNDSNPIYADLQEIDNTVERASALTKQLLTFSRKQVVNPQVIALNTVVREIEKMLQRLIGEDIKLVTVLDPELGMIKADSGQIEQVIMNIGINARDAMPQGGRLTIETKNIVLDTEYSSKHMALQPGNYIMLAISDTGCGMDTEIQSHIFEPFFTTKESGKGTGLGLSTVYGIIKQCGGNILVYSELGRGTTFKIYFPRVEADVQQAKSLATSMDNLHGSETVLVVEDEEVVRDLAKRILNRYGYKVLSAINGEDAIQICQKANSPMQLMITDVVMPGMSGRQLAEHFAKVYPTTKVLFISGYTDDAIIQHGILAPGAPFLQKPFSPHSLLSKVREVLTV